MCPWQGPAPRGAGEHWFELAPRDGPACVYACRSRQQCLHWLARLRQAAQPQRDATRRTENALRLWVLEAKGLPVKKKYFCELRLDDTLYARTSAKLKTQLCFWGEHFEFRCGAWGEGGGQRRPLVTYRPLLTQEPQKSAL